MTSIGSTPPVAVQAATVAAKPQATASAASSNATFKTPAELVEVGEKFLDNLASHMASADGARWRIEHMDEVRAARGAEFANKHRALMQDLMVRSESMAQTDIAALHKAFSVSGDLVTRNEEGRRVLGKFTLSGQGPGFAVRIDSEKGAAVSGNGGPFTGDFARITPPQLRNLPYLKAVADTLNVKV